MGSSSTGMSYRFAKCHTKRSSDEVVYQGRYQRLFDRINHTIVLNILRDKIHDNRFIRLISRLLEAGYLEDWKYNATYSGVPQGGVVSPILSNLC